MSRGPYQAWGASGAPSAVFFREVWGFKITFPAVAEFHISETGELLRRDDLVDPDVSRAIFEQQVLPLLLSLRGEQVFHGGAVAIGDEAIAILGPSGRGKSTLTTAFARRGHAFLGDDCLHLDLSGARVHVNSHADHVRLWEDSAAALGDGAAAYVTGSPKPRLSAGERLPHCDHALPLARVYLLGDHEVDSPRIEAVSPSQQLINWTANAFVLDIKNPEVLRRNLAAGARLVREVPMRKLDYPRRYELLDSVVDAVLADVAA